MSTTKMKQAELEKIHVEIAKLMAETTKINREAKWYPVVVASSLIAAGAAAMALVIKFL